MNILQALKDGKVEGISELPQRHVETVMSDVLIYTNVVRKVYKQDREGIFLDLQDFDTRKQFYIDDFQWNQDVSSSIHTALHGVIETEEGNYKTVPPTESDVWFIEMVRVKDTDTLFRRLSEKTATKEHITELTKKQTLGLQSLTKNRLSGYEDLLDQGLQKLWEMRLDQDLRLFGKSFGKEIPAELVDSRVDTLLKYFRKSEFFQNLSREDAAIAIDNHAGNVVFYEEEPHFIDIYLVKREWRVIDHHNNIARMATCVRVLGNDDLADAMYEEYENHHKLAPREIYDFQESYNALIKGYYYTYLRQPEVAQKYFYFADSILEKLA